MIGADGQLDVLSGGIDSGTIVDAGGQDFNSGSAIDVIVNNDAVLGADFLSLDTVVNSGGEEIVYGTATSSTVYSGGLQDVYHSAVSAWLDGGTQYLLYGAAAGTVIDDGGTQDVAFNYGHALAIDTTINFGGSQIVFGGGSATGSVINNGGNETVSSGGSDVGATVHDGGNQSVLSGGSATDTVVQDPGRQIVDAGGTVTNVQISGGEQYLYGQATSTILGSGFDSATSSTYTGYQDVFSGGVASATSVGDGGKEVVAAGGVTSATVVSSGGILELQSGGEAVDTTVLAGGTVIVDQGGGLAGSVFKLVEQTSGSATLDGPLDFVGSGSTLDVGGPVADLSGFVIDGFVAGDAIDLTSLSYGSGASAELLTNNVLQVTVGGSSFELDLDPSQYFLDATFSATSDGGSGTDLSIVQLPVTTSISVPDGSVIYDIQIGNGGWLEVASGGYASGTTVGAGGFLIVDSGGTASGGTVNSGGSLYVSSGGSAVGATISDGGKQYVELGGTASNTFVTDPGLQIVSAGGTSTSASISGGEQYVYGLALDTSVTSGVDSATSSAFTGYQDVFSGGVASNTSVGNGGQEIVFSGGTTSDTTILSGGELQLSEGASVDGALTLEAGAALEIGSGYTLAGVTVENGVALDVASGGIVSDPTVWWGGTLNVSEGGTLAAGGFSLIEQSVNGADVTGPFNLSSDGATLDIGGATSNLSGFAISGFADGDTVDLTSLGYASGGSADLLSSNLLQISEDGSVFNLQLDPNQSFSSRYFHVANDGFGNTSIIENSTPCYCPGTLIETERGNEVPIENLVIGDRVMTISGILRPIKWIGRRSYSGRFALGQKHILPVCIRAGALDDNVPRRDLRISPQHAMYLEGVLIEAKNLVNGRSIVQLAEIDQVEYIHLELETHDVLIAEGALSESFIDDDSRGMFHNAPEYRIAYPDERCAPARYCAPRPDGGYEIEAARQRIEGRAGLRPAKNKNEKLTLRGYVDCIGLQVVAGWAQNVEYPEAPVCLDIFVGDRMIGQTLANRYREDLERARLGSGRHSFEFILPAGLRFTPDEVEVRRSLDGEVIRRERPRQAEPKSVSAGRRYVKTVNARGAAF